MTRKPDPKYNFDTNNMPTLAQPWNGQTVPPIPEIEETGSDRRPRGSLEMLVEYVTKDWFVNHITDPDRQPTAENIAKWVTEVDGKPCSSGAVWGILDRWERIKFASCSTKPKRLDYFLHGAFSMGLPELYRREKRRKINEKKFGRFGSTDSEYIPIVMPDVPESES